MLDLDLDFFLDRVSWQHPEGKRWDSDEGDPIYEPWDEGTFRTFLEAACGLSQIDAHQVECYAITMKSSIAGES